MKKRRELTPAELEIAKRAMAQFLYNKKHRGLTQVKLAEAVGMSQSGVGQYLNGEIPFNLPALILFAKEFNCSLQDLDPDCEHILPITPQEKALIAAYRDMTYRQDVASAKALLQVAELSPIYRVTLEHNAKKAPSVSDQNSETQ